MDRIALDKTLTLGKEVLLEGPPLEALLFRNVRVGSLVTLTDREGRDFRGRVLRCSSERAAVFLFEAFSSSTESPLELILLQALPDKERMEWIIQKTTELGVAAIVPFKSERSISLEEREARQRKAHRWQEIALKAVRQSRRARVPVVETYRSFEEALNYGWGEGLKLLLWEREGRSLKEVLKRPSGSNLPPERTYLMVGPEGGFTLAEVERACQRGFIPVKLGQRILRTETAAIVLVGILQYEWGDLALDRSI
ncbi:MAG: 16S rRNA (uracil(1498)-N(3))-methyltransferase [Desulfobacterota bacterium]|nr:16S rRNA (uracil(1498)-N(3))-methyltransferase [Thermodesulfobacteriota bacterium]